MKSFLIKNRKKLFILLGIILFFSVFLFIPEISYAWAGDAVAKVIGFIISPIIWLFGQLVIMLLNILIKVAQYNHFIHSSAVSYGWTLVRDLCNMFFVLILLVIAFATILRVESYNLKALLPKLIIMAVLINFSKLICGIFIDFAQVIMLTFINAVKDIAGANLTHMLGISEILAADKDPKVTALTVIGSLLLALIMVIIATIVILTILVVLVMRIIMIWIYVVLSPLAYLLASFPQGKSYSEKWWSDFSKNLIIGPVLAFFLWLSFASLGGTSAYGDDIEKIGNAGEDWETEAVAEKNSEVDVGITQAGSMDNMIKFIISIGMLLGGLMIAQEMGGVAGQVAGKGMGKIKAMGAGALKTGKRVARSIGRRAGELGVRGAGKVTGSKILKGWGQDMKESRKGRAVKSRQKIMTNLGMGKHAGAAGQEMTDKIKGRLNDVFGRGERKTKEGSEKIREGGELKAQGELEIKTGEDLKIQGETELKLAGELENEQENLNVLREDLNKTPQGDPKREEIEAKIDLSKARLNDLRDETGDKEALSLQVEGEEEEILGQDLQKFQSELDESTAKLAGLSNKDSDEYKEAEKERDNAKTRLDNKKKEAGVDPESSSLEVSQKAEDLIQSGQDKKAEGERIENESNEDRILRLQNDGQKNINDGNLNIKSGEDKKVKGEALSQEGDVLSQKGKKIKDRGLGNLLLEHTNKAFSNLNEAYNKAKKIVESIAEDSVDLTQLSAGDFSGPGGDLNTKQMKVLNDVNQDKRASQNLVKLIEDKNKAGASISDDEIKVINSLSSGLGTYKAAAGSTASEGTNKIIEAIKKLANNNVKIKEVNTSKPGRYNPGELTAKVKTKNQTEKNQIEQEVNVKAEVKDSRDVIKDIIKEEGSEGGEGSEGEEGSEEKK
jgi:hypothetical protein